MISLAHNPPVKQLYLININQMKNNLGFTLIELIISFALFSILTLGTTLMLTSILRTSAQTSIATKVHNEGSFLMETISQRIRYSKSATCLDFNSDGLDYTDAVDIISVDGSSNTKFFCNYGEDAIQRDVKDSDHTMNSTTEVLVVDCSFTCTPSYTDPTSIEVKIAVQDINGIIDPITFDTNIVLRNK